MSNELFNDLNRSTYLLYVHNTECTSTNDLRYEIFRQKNGKVQSGQLPPCEDVLYLHAKRTNYQAGIWRRFLQRSPAVPNPDGHGWEINDRCIQVSRMSGLPAPEAISEFFSCNCKKICKGPSCPCVRNNLKCTAACRLTDCNNYAVVQDYESDSDSD